MANIVRIEQLGTVHAARIAIERMAADLGSLAPNELGIAGAKLEDLEETLTDQIDS